MKAILRGGPSDGRLIDVAPKAQKIKIATLEDPQARWYEDDEEPPAPAFVAVVYIRTDTRWLDRVVFNCEKLDTTRES